MHLRAIDQKMRFWRLGAAGSRLAVLALRTSGSGIFVFLTAWLPLVQDSRPGPAPDDGRVSGADQIFSQRRLSVEAANQTLRSKAPENDAVFAKSAAGFPASC